MRPDLNKLLCEHERIGSSRSYGDDRNLKVFEEMYQDRYEDDEPFAGIGNAARESMKKRFNWMYNSKEFGENLNPLYGIIKKNVGRRWDKVYSELCEVFDMRSVINQHILQHLYSYVEVKDMFIGKDGKPWVRNRHGGDEPIKGSTTEYYVDPRDNVLKRNNSFTSYRQANRQREAERIREKAKTFRKIHETLELHKFGDVWFKIDFTLFKGYTKTVARSHASYNPNKKPRIYYHTTTEYPPTFDVLEKKTVERNRVATAKSTASHKELKQYGIVD